MNNIQQAIREIRQSRSRFQLEKFVVGQHDTPEMQYYQCCLEANSVIRAIRDTELRIKKTRAEIEELLETGKKSDAVEAEIKQMIIEDMELNLIGSKRELAILEEIFSKYPRYTREDIEKSQPDYWKQRLICVGQLQHLGAASGVNWAQLEAIYRADLLPYARDTLANIEMLEHKPSELLFNGTIKRKEVT